MKTRIKILLAVYMLLAISCKKENTAIQSSGSRDESTTQALLTDMNEPAAKEVTIGTQVWMKRNWTGDRYRNGDRIPQVTSPAKWASLTTGAWCWYNNDSANGKIYGKLYNWYAVNDPRGLAPEGWHVPSDAEWTTLTTYLGDNAGGKMKSTGTIEAGTGLWHAPNFNATNSSGFTGLPGGLRRYDGPFRNFGNFGVWWSSTVTVYNTSKAWYRGLYQYGNNVTWSSGLELYGFSVRCLRD